MGRSVAGDAEPVKVSGSSYGFCSGNGVWERCDFPLPVPSGTFSEEILTVEWGWSWEVGGRLAAWVGRGVRMSWEDTRRSAVPAEGLGPCDLLPSPPLGPVDFEAVAFWGNPLAPFLPASGAGVVCPASTSWVWGERMTSASSAPGPSLPGRECVLGCLQSVGLLRGFTSSTPPSLLSAFSAHGQGERASRECG